LDKKNKYKSKVTSKQSCGKQTEIVRGNQTHMHVTNKVYGKQSVGTYVINKYTRKQDLYNCNEASSHLPKKEADTKIATNQTTRRSKAKQILKHPAITTCNHSKSAITTCNHSNTQPLQHVTTQSQPLQHLTTQPVSHYKMQPPKQSAITTCNHSNIQPLQHATTQTGSHYNMQPLKYSAITTCNHSNRQQLQHATTQTTNYSNI
jgi:hypothetical protein